MSYYTHMCYDEALSSSSRLSAAYYSADKLMKMRWETKIQMKEDETFHMDCWE